MCLQIAGALAEEGRSLEEIVAVCNDAIPNMGKYWFCNLIYSQYTHTHTHTHMYMHIMYIYIYYTSRENRKP